jgi:iron complex outermembrane receptor protein
VDLVGPGVGPAFCLYPNAPDNCRVPVFWDFDLTGRYKLTDKIGLFGAIKNFFDTKPPVDSADYAAVDYNPTYAQSEIVDRSFSIGVRVAY